MESTLLKTLLIQRHLQRYESFRAEYERLAADIRPGLQGSAPSRAQYFRWLSGELKGGLPYPDACRVLEGMFPPWTASDLFAPPHAELVTSSRDAAGSGSSLLAGVAPTIPAKELGGAWVTGYQFSDPARHHVDIAHVTVESEKLVRVANFPPEPRTEGHAVPFRNAIEGELVGRHITGYWKNLSDSRYLGVLHLAIQPGETMMDGYYTGLDSDVQVSVGPWRWVRLAPDSLTGTDFSRVTLTEPARLYELLGRHTQYDAPLTLADVTEDE